MSDLGDTFKAWGKVKKEKKIMNIIRGLDILRNENIDFIILNKVNWHVRVEGFDYYPSTGLFKKGNIKGRGINNLIKKIKNKTTLNKKQIKRNCKCEKE